MIKIYEIKEEVDDAGIEPIAPPIDTFCSQLPRSKVKIKRPESDTIV